MNKKIPYQQPIRLKVGHRKMLEECLNSPVLLQIITKRRNAHLLGVKHFIELQLKYNSYLITNRKVLNTYRKCYLEYRLINKIEKH